MLRRCMELRAHFIEVTAVHGNARPATGHTVTAWFGCRKAFLACSRHGGLRDFDDGRSTRCKGATQGADPAAGHRVAVGGTPITSNGAHHTGC